MASVGGRVKRQQLTQEKSKFEAEMQNRAKKATERHEQEQKEEKKEVKTKQGKIKDEPTEEKPLRVESLEFYPKENAKEHHTETYEIVQLKPITSVLLRRGQTFYFGIRFKNRIFNPNRETVKLEFTFGPKPNVVHGTKADILVKEKPDFKPGTVNWEAAIHHQKDNIITMHVKIPSFACVGLWKCVIETGFKGKKKKKRFECPEDFYILFNPWCKNDDVYMENETWRYECVLNDVGKVYNGVFKAPTSRDWVYGQFDDVVLPACLLLLDRSNLDYGSRGDPVKVVRAISAVVNSRDDKGLLVDNWSGDYSNGTNPSDWTGSLKIFQQFAENGGKAVSFGQCWVFAGCVTTFCRALGIPCRNVTNYISAHDCHQNLTVDKFFDSEGELKTDMDIQDSVWNFHVWNEVWMARPDLPKGYGGWQAIDATPQEQSEGSFRLGPASVAAVQRGEIGLQYDTMFVVSEVNADVIYWQDDEESEIGLRQMKSNKYFIGKKIVTKDPSKYDKRGVADADEITQCYKNKEGTQEERLQLLNAARNARLWYLYDTPKFGTEDIEFDLVDIESVMIGEPFEVLVKIKNLSKEKRTVFAVLSASSVYYTGILALNLKKEKRELVLAPQQEQELKLKINREDYIEKLVENSMIKISATASVQETRQSWAEEDDFTVKKPALLIKFAELAVVDKPLTVSWIFKNPLSVLLDHCRFSFEGPGLSRPKQVKFRDVKPGEEVVHQETLIPRRAGERTIVGSFGSRQLTEINGSAIVVVKDK